VINGKELSPPEKLHSKQEKEDIKSVIDKYHHQSTITCSIFDDFTDANKTKDLSEVI
jgi:hypothetical protein